MQWTDAILEHVQALKPVQTSPALMQRLMGLVDLTSLNDDDSEASMLQLFEKSRNNLGHVAAVCVNPAFVSLAVTEFAGSPIKVATVANFPDGAATLESVLIEINRALEDGAQEIDVVFPYQRYLAGERQFAQSFVGGCRAACGDHMTLKVILETGALMDPAIIADASYDALSAGADFIKTSTGKIPEGASLDAAATMLLVIKHMSTQLKHRIGFKVSGGIRDIQQAAQYVELADRIMGKEWVAPTTFRIGASKLVDQMLNEVGGNG
jgi:deoxyribose-phosphate aldolase